jgi:hypothetical protein
LTTAAPFDELALRRATTAARIVHNTRDDAGVSQRLRISKVLAVVQADHGWKQTTDEEFIATITRQGRP